jgi:hypothetical protein
VRKKEISLVSGKVTSMFNPLPSSHTLMASRKYLRSCHSTRQLASPDPN